MTFRKDWESILTLLLRENSPGTLAEEILARCVNITGSCFGALLFVDEEVSSQSDFILCGRKYLLPEKNAILNEIKSNLSFLLEWFKVNKRPLSVTLSNENNIAQPLINLFQVNSLVIAPSFMNDSVLSLSILGKQEENSYTRNDLHNIEQFASVLAFSVTNLLTRKLNATLENKLLQSQKLETIGKLASGMAHDFNNLLSSIFGSINLLKRKLSDRDDVFYLLENIENCSARAADLTKGLLSYGKPTPKRKTLIRPAHLMKELMLVIGQTFPESIEIEDFTEPGLNDFLGNATEIYQVLLNLCVNAREAIHGNGRVSIEARNVKILGKGSLDFPLLKEGDYVCFSVKDTGEGISEENLNRIFDPYFSTKEKETGSGLGLYVTYGIVKAHNGYIDVKSKPGRGTEFNVYIPAFDESSDPASIKTEKIILLADDEIMLRDILAELLESYNYQVIGVNNGKEVIKVLTEEIKVDLLIIDYKMPEMDGLSCIKKIQELGINVPVILSTGSTSTKTDEDFGKLKIDSVLAKPYEFDRMLSEVKKLI
ncbi:MAG: response regulator [Ignavibacteria bacterium]|nr:response regulator [Ignavibacteria bacterium]MCU7503772.1 response regulator [Ignavibacteria bacterium]MCU7517214.1 response regulator [Ignavibacteria bacterium]